jgi:hypothetical protein
MPDCYRGNKYPNSKNGMTSMKPLVPVIRGGYKKGRVSYSHAELQK